MRQPYLVVLRDDADPAAALSVVPSTPRHVYTLLNAFAIDLDEAELQALGAHEDVTTINADRVLGLATVRRLPEARCIGLERITRRERHPFGQGYGHHATGAGVHAYIIDSGIYPDHEQFGGRVSLDWTATQKNGVPDYEDDAGHGTHVAGIVGGSEVGVAPGVALHSIRVIGASGTTPTATLIAALDWVAAHHQKPAVANISLSGSYDPILNRAVASLAAAGVHVSVAAGNDGLTAFLFSPGSELGVLTVGSVDPRDDVLSDFSNYGSSVDVLAPGKSVLSTWLTGPTATQPGTGTSQAAPHACGVAALLKETYGDLPQRVVDDWIIRESTKDAVTINRSRTANRLLYKQAL